LLRLGSLLLIVDFTPQLEESLQQEHKRRRLGFDDEEVTLWFKSKDMDLINKETLSGGPLTVGI
jgi:hypothetical protein